MKSYEDKFSDSDEGVMENNPAKPGRGAGKVVITMLVVAVAVLSAITVYYYSQWKVLKNNPQKVAQDEVTAVVEKLRKIMILPDGEQPTIATVVDPAKLKDQPFFAKAKVGDKVLIYTNARKAILYDSVSNKIVEVAPLNIGNPAQ